MKKKLLEMIEKAEPYEPNVPMNLLYLIDTKKIYNGFWGENGYNNMLVIGYSRATRKYYKITDHSDVVYIADIRYVDFDIPSDLGCVRVCCNQNITNPHDEVLSSCHFYGENK